MRRYVRMAGPALLTYISPSSVPKGNILVQLMLAVLLFLVTSAITSEAAEMCSEPKLENVSISHPECLFFAGTAAFRMQNYSLARSKWQALIDLKALPLEHQHLQISAYNNLGFLYYQGLGTRKNHPLAIEYWSYATNAGHEEAAYHLCHTYGESYEPEYNPKRALSFCKESLRRYSQLRNQDDAMAEVVNQLKQYITKLESPI